MTTNVKCRLSILTIVMFILCINMVSAQTIAKKSNIKLINSRQHIKKAIDYHDDKEYTKADKLYSEVPKSDSLYHLALYERALTAYSLNKYDEAIAFCNEGLTLREGKSGFYALLGNLYDEKKMPQKAIEIFNEALKQFPYNQQMYYNLAVVYSGIDSLNEAEINLIKSLKLNPFHFRSNYLLGQVNERKGKMVEALLCYYMASVIQPRQTDAVAQLMVYLNGESKLVSLASKYSGADNEKLPQFEQIEDILNSKIALNPKYKTKARINEVSVKQGQMLFDKLVYNPSIDNFYMNYYVPFFVNIREKGYYEPFFYTIFSSFDGEQIQSWLKRKKSKQSKFITDAAKKIVELRKVGLENTKLTKDPIYYVFNEEGNLQSFGRYSNKMTEIKTGIWTSVHENGGLESITEFVNGKEEGVIVGYNSEGVKNIELTMKNGAYSGPYSTYHDNGVKSTEGTTLDGKLDGPFKYFYPSGQLKEEGVLKNNKLIGKNTVYFLDGTISGIYNYVDGKADGEVVRNYVDGTMSEKYTYKDDKFHGEYTSYYPNKSVKIVGKYEKGKPTGKWIEYYADGVISSTYTLNSKGENIDTTFEYYPDGKIEEMSVFNGSKATVYQYSREGKIYYKSKREDGVVQSYEAYDTEGKVIDKAEVTNKTLNFKMYNPQGFVTVVGKITNNKYDGYWVYYNSHGLKLESRSIKNGEYHGNDTTFWESGAIKRVMPYKNGKQDGYFEEYHPNGSIAREGWYVDDNEQGLWKEYEIDGSISSNVYYANGNYQGWQDYFYPTGKLKEQNFYEYDYYSYKVLYDTLGKAYYTKRMENGNGQYELVEIGGEKILEAKMIGGNFFGPQTRKYANGVIRMTATNVNDRYFGKVDYYTEEGTPERKYNYINNIPWGSYESYSYGFKSYTCNYINGNIYGASKWYYSNGKVECEYNYLNDETDGKTTYYAPDGQVMLVVNFSWGNPISYTYKDKSGGFVTPIKIGKDTVHLVAYYQNGVKSVDCYYINGVKTGNIEYYFPNGKLYSKLSRIGREDHGAFIENYANGSPLVQKNYYYGVLNGPHKVYHENGVLKSDEVYYFGSKHGEASYYDAKGKLIKKRIYFYGTMISETKI